jgi:hypothetical protein
MSLLGGMLVARRLSLTLLGAASRASTGVLGLSWRHGQPASPWELLGSLRSLSSTPPRATVLDGKGCGSSLSL